MKKIRKVIICLNILLVILIGVPLIRVTATDNRLILEIDDEDGLPEYIGKTLSFKFTCVSKAPHIDITMYFDNLPNNPVFVARQDFFVNYLVTIDIVQAGLLSGVEHEFVILAEDSWNETQSITQKMTIDITAPIINSLAINKVVNDNKEKIESNAIELHREEYLEINYSVYDEYFKEVRFYTDNKEPVDRPYPVASTVFIGDAYFIIENPVITQQTFDFKIVAYDKAENVDTYTWKVTFIRDTDNMIPEDILEEEMEKAKQEKIATRNGDITGSILSGTIGIIFGIPLALVARSRVKGFVGIGNIMGQFQALPKGEDETYKPFTDTSPIGFFKKYIVSRFGLVIILFLTLITGWYWLGLRLSTFLSFGNIFFEFMFKSSVIVFPIFMLIAFVVTFLTKKGDFKFVKSNLPFADKAGIFSWIIPYFYDLDNRRKIATSDVVDAINGNYFNIDFDDSNRLRFQHNQMGETLVGTYIPTKDIDISCRGLQIDPYCSAALQCVQEVTDAETLDESQEKQEIADILDETETELITQKREYKKVLRHIDTESENKASQELATIYLQEAAMNDYIEMEEIDKQSEMEERAKQEVKKEMK